MIALLINRLTIRGAVLIVMMGCHMVMAETADMKSAKPIVLFVGEEQDLAGCKKLGRVTGASQESDNDKTYPERVIIARDNLKNEAANLGANTIHVMQSSAARVEIPGVSKQIIFTGKAYNCI